MQSAKKFFHFNPLLWVLAVSEKMKELNRWNVEQYNTAAGYVSKSFGGDLLDILTIRDNERVLDLGCGDGVLSMKIQQMGAKVIGIDSSEEMVEFAREEYKVDARRMDGCSMNFENEFDIVFSNAALHWMTDTNRMLDGVARSLTSGGQFIAECGGFGNIAAIVTAIVAILEKHGISNAKSYIPWVFHHPDAFEKKLQHAGFKVLQIQLNPRPVHLPEGILGWLKTFADNFVQPFPKEQHDAIFHEIQELLRPVNGLCSIFDNRINGRRCALQMEIGMQITYGYVLWQYGNKCIMFLHQCTSLM